MKVTGMLVRNFELNPPAGPIYTVGFLLSTVARDFIARAARVMEKPYIISPM